jgi:hypothetical protein
VRISDQDGRINLIDNQDGVRLTVDDTGRIVTPSWDSNGVSLADARRRLAPARLLRPRTVMASPPTVGALATVSAIASGIAWPATSVNAPNPLGEHFTYHNGADPVQYGAGFPDFAYVKVSNLTTTNIVSAPFVVSFYFEGTTLELQFKGQLGDLLIKVDDQYVSLTPTSVTATGSQYFLPVTFATRDIRRIDVLMRGLIWGGVQTGPNDTIRRAETRGPRCIVLGDSFTEGTGATAGASSAWTRSFQESLGWDDCFASGDGSTGYLSPGVGGRVKFRDRVQHDVIGYSPGVVVVQGGINDYATFTPAAVQAEATTLFQQIINSASRRSSRRALAVLAQRPFHLSGNARTDVTSMSRRDQGRRDSCWRDVHRRAGDAVSVVRGADNDDSCRRQRCWS